VDQGLRNAILKDYEVRETNAGFIIENLIGMKLYKNSKEKNENVYYLINGEVDFIIKNKETLAVEVKYQENITKKDVKNILRFMNKYDLKHSLLVTKNLYKKEKIDGKQISYIPAWLFLLAY
ncbi:MAG: ATP-binding protein, partial [Thermoplasmata archaeon]|nr:ATP-binding protein [Thermoplasmata archaeon]